VSKVEFAILGAGAMGSIIGAHLTRTGHSVAMLARGQRARVIAEQGLRIKGLIEFTTSVETITDPRELEAAEVLILTTKALGTAAALEPLRHSKIGAALSIQNGVMKDELLAGAFGPDRVLGALANTSGELLPSGEVLFTRNINIAIGELAGGTSSRAARIAEAIDASGVRSSMVPDIQTQEWSKFAGWVGFMALAVTTRVNSWKFLVDPGAALVLVRLVREVGRLAEACGVQCTDDSMLPIATLCRQTESEAVEIVRAVGREYHANAPQHRLSTLQDLEAGRPLEIDETLGFAVAKAAQLKLSLPLLENFYHVASAIGRTRG
jgi:2-dehydropantoate 2-reductase